MDIHRQCQRWIHRADADTALSLLRLSEDPAALSDAFYRNLSFGTGGLRGVIGPGTNCMNLYTVSKASQGLADYVIRRFPKASRSIAVSYDSRLLSDAFAQAAASVFAANEIAVYIYPSLMPTPCLSFAVRALGCAAGVMITASHNPANYNGYKVYGPDGCQITTEAAGEILAEIEKLDIFDDICSKPYAAALKDGSIRLIPDDVYDGYVDHVTRQSLMGPDVPVDYEAAVVYSPLNGTGLKPVLDTLAKRGFTNVSVVKEQENPDGRFPTCPYPNPEVDGAMALGIEYARRTGTELFLATDPDCDRVGVAVRDAKGGYRLLTGNETGLLLLDYICQRRVQLGSMPKDPVMVKTIVTTDMAERIAAHYGVRTLNVPTGFKFIGEQIGRLEKAGKEASYLFGFEESGGYLSGTYVRDKDGVNGALLVCEMFAYHRARGVSLADRLDMLYRAYGYCLNTLHSYFFEGAAGLDKMRSIMAAFRGGLDALGGKAVLKCLDYSQGLDGLPKCDMLKFVLTAGCSVAVRPSGTEPKLKVYLSVSAPDRETALALEKKLADGLAVRMA